MMQQIEARIRICRGGGGEQKRKSKRHVPEVVSLAPQLFFLAFHLFLFYCFLSFFPLELQYILCIFLSFFFKATVCIFVVLCYATSI